MAALPIENIAAITDNFLLEPEAFPGQRIGIDRGVEVEIERYAGCRPKKFDLGLGSSQLPQLWHDHGVLSAFSIIVRLAWDLLLWCGLMLRPRESLEAENLFLRRQLALYLERGAKPKRVDAASRVMLVLLSRCFDWRGALSLCGRRR